MTRGETERAVAVLKKIASINGRDVPEQVYQNFKVIMIIQKALETTGDKSHFQDFAMTGNPNSL